MSATLNDLMQSQKLFDENHEGAVPFFEVVHGGALDALEHLVVCIVGEVGEFANIVKKIRRGDYSYSSKEAELTEELADIFIYVLKAANQLGIDLESAYKDKMKKNSKRFAGFRK